MSRLTDGQTRALRLAGDGLLVAVWLKREGEFPGIGLKPWYAVSGQRVGRYLHGLWLDGLLRLDRDAALLTVEGGGFVVGRARLTPDGVRALHASSRASG